MKAPAKINLFLKVLRRRDDGYHDIYSWFQAIDLFDNLSFEKSSDAGITLSVEGDFNLPDDEENLVVKTARLMFKKFGLTGGLKIFLKKIIPVSAGLGGGSSDAATTIYAINSLYNLNLSREEMSGIGLEIGSDVPFFFSSGQAEITGRGEKIRDISLPLDYSIVLITPDIVISTAESYRRLKLDLTSFKPFVKFLENKGFAEFIKQIFSNVNDFEENCLASYEELREVRDVLNRSGAALTRMSGTGPSIFGIYDRLPEGGEEAQFTRGNWHVFLVHPITLPAWH